MEERQIIQLTAAATTTRVSATGCRMQDLLSAAPDMLFQDPSFLFCPRD